MRLSEIEFGQAYILVEEINGNRIYVLESPNVWLDEYCRVVGTESLAVLMLKDPITKECLITPETWVLCKATELMKALV